MQKIFLALGVCLAFLFSDGMLFTILELHLVTFGLSDMMIALCFDLSSAAYFIFSLINGYIFRKIDERATMVIGIACLGTGYLLLGPCNLIFPRALEVILSALPMLGFGQSLCLSKI